VLVLTFILNFRPASLSNLSCFSFPSPFGEGGRRPDEVRGNEGEVVGRKFRVMPVNKKRPAEWQDVSIKIMR
jgi:hypothetical protein